MPHLTLYLPLFCETQCEFDSKEEVIILNGPKYTGKWTLTMEGQKEFAGISDDGLANYDRLRKEAKSGRTPQGLAIEKLFLTRIREEKGIEKATYEEERRRKRKRGGHSQPVASEPVMDEEEVDAQFDE